MTLLSVRVDEPIPESLFVFIPPSDAKRVEAWALQSLRMPLREASGRKPRLPPGMTYTGSETEFWRQPRPNKVDPEYTEEARIAKASGKVLVQVVVTKEGKPEDVRVIRSFGYGLDDKALDSVGRWVFRPGMKDGQPVAVRATIEVNFRMAAKEVEEAIWHPGALIFQVPEGLSRPVVTRSVRMKDPPAGASAAVVELELEVDEVGVPHKGSYREVRRGGERRCDPGGGSAVAIRAGPQGW